MPRQLQYVPNGLLFVSTWTNNNPIPANRKQIWKVSLRLINFSTSINTIDMKNWNKKNIVIVVLSLSVVGGVFLFLYGHQLEALFHRWQNSDKIYYPEEAATELAAAVETYGHPEADRAADAAYNCDGLYFYGDEGYLTKGALLDQSAAATYNSLPDTIFRMAYGEQLQQMNEKNAEYYDKKARFAPVKRVEDNTVLTSYLRLAEQGKVEYLRCLPNSQGSLELEDQCDFRHKYGDYFDVDIAAQRAIPLAVKDVLSDYFQSDEGSKFTFVTDRRKIENVVLPGTFTGLNQYTGKPNKEVAVVLAQKDRTDSNRERLLVIGYDDKNHRGYILYNESFYSTKILIKKYSDPYKLPEEAVSLAKYVTPNNQLLEIKTDNDGRFYLYYEEEFDTMTKKSFGEEESEGCGGC